MEIKAKLKHLRISPRKVRLVAGLIRGMETSKAIEQLKFMNKKAAKPVEKLLNSGIANAVNNYELDENNLFIKEIRVDDGVTLKRWMPRAHGRATPIRKRSSHVEIILKEIKESNKKTPKKKKIEAPVKLSDMNKVDDKAKKIENKEVDKKDVQKDKDIKKTEKGVSGKDKKGFVGKMFRRKSS
jgi:large subunit ribosomal protein L22